MNTLLLLLPDLTLIGLGFVLMRFAGWDRPFLAARMGGDGPYVARLITVSMLAALVTLPAWLSLIR